MITKVGLYPDKRNKNRKWVVRWFGEPDETGKIEALHEGF